MNERAKETAMSEAEIAAAAAAVLRGELKIGGGPSDQGWVIQRVGERLWYSSWRASEAGTIDEEDREASEAELLGALRRYGRKVIRKR